MIGSSSSNEFDCPLISVVIDNYNYDKFVLTAIESALELDSRTVEVIVVDDGSTDRSREVLQTMASHVQLIFKENQGQASAMNSGFAASRGEWVTFLDADDVLLEDYVGIVLEYSQPDISKITWQMPIIGPQGKRLNCALPPPADGCLLDTLCILGPLSFVCSPCSGNIWARSFLEAVMPIPEVDFRRGADGYLLQTSPVYGRTAVANRPGSEYRRHGSNFLAAKSEFEVRDTLRERYPRLAGAVATHLQKNEIQFDQQNWRHEHWDMLDEIERAVCDHIPTETSVLLLDDDVLNVGCSLLGRPRLYLSTDERGRYAGPPAGSESIVRELRQYLENGLQYLAVASYSFWWLDYYDELRAAIERSFVELHRSNGLIIYKRRPSQP